MQLQIEMFLSWKVCSAAELFRGGWRCDRGRVASHLDFAPAHPPVHLKRLVVIGLRIVDNNLKFEISASSHQGESWYARSIASMLVATWFLSVWHILCWLVSSALFDCSNNYLITPESIQILQFFQISKFATSTFHCDLGSRHSQSPIQSISQFSRANVLILLLPTAGETAGLFSAGT